MLGNSHKRGFADVDSKKNPQKTFNGTNLIKE